MWPVLHHCLRHLWEIVDDATLLCRRGRMINTARTSLRGEGSAVFSIAKTSPKLKSKIINVSIAYLKSGVGVDH